MCVFACVVCGFFFGNFLRSRTIGESIQIYVLFSLYIYDIYFSSTVSLSLSHSISRPITRTYLLVRRFFFSLRFSLPFFRRREKCIYIHKSFTFTLVTLNCICFTPIDERSLSSRSQSSFLARYT